MTYEEYSREEYRAKCACGKGFVRYYKIYRYNDWGHEENEQIPVEIVCADCKDKYYHEKRDGLDDYLMTKGWKFPQRAPKIDFLLSNEEKWAGKYSIQELEEILEDMTAPKRRWIKDLQHEDAKKFADDQLARTGMRALKPMIQALKEILYKYDSLKESYKQKMERKKEYMGEVEEYRKEDRAATEQSIKLSFECYLKQDSVKHEKALKDLEKYKEERKEEDLLGLKYHLTYEKDFTNLFWDSYRIKECIGQEVKRDPFEKKLVKKYLCECHMCGHEMEYLSSDFCIKNEGQEGYSLVPCCMCHKVSSSEVKAMDILNKLGISYVREMTFEGLVGDGGGDLRFDLALYRERGEDLMPKIDLLIELQGPHHYKIGYYDEYGEYITENIDADKMKEVELNYNRTVRHDKEKIKYCESHHINLECIKYTLFDYIDLRHEMIKILKKYGYDYFVKRDD